MIGDNEVNTGSACSLSGGEGADAGIHTNDHPNAIAGSALDYLVAHAVAFADTVRNVKVSRASTKLDRSLENDNGGGAVHVVIAINQDFFFTLQCRIQPIKRGFHAAHQQRVVEVTNGGRQKKRGSVG